jgi:hypothetical protein
MLVLSAHRLLSLRVLLLILLLLTLESNHLLLGQDSQSI